MKRDNKDGLEEAPLFPTWGYWYVIIVVLLIVEILIFNFISN
jgi:hypothetical protein